MWIAWSKVDRKEWMKKRHLDDEPREYTKRELRLAGLRNNKIDNIYLSDLIIDYKLKRSLDSGYGMPRELAEVVQVIIEKMIGSPSWRGYSEDWKEEFRGKAIEHVLKYAHNFSPEKSKRGKGDAFNYFAMITVNAFVQALKKCKAYSENNISINTDLLYDEARWNQNNEFKYDPNDIDQSNK